MPRFVSLKPDRVNVRGGPTRDHEVTFVYTAGLPVEITARSDNWRRIRGWEGSEGWVYHSLLSGRRTAVVMPKDKNKLVPLYDRGDSNGGGRAIAGRRARRGEALLGELVPYRRSGLRRLGRAGAAMGGLPERKGGVASVAFRGRHHFRGKSEMRTSEPKPQGRGLPVSVDCEVRKRTCRTMMRTSESRH